MEYIQPHRLQKGMTIALLGSQEDITAYVEPIKSLGYQVRQVPIETESIGDKWLHSMEDDDCQAVWLVTDYENLFDYTDYRQLVAVLASSISNNKLSHIQAIRKKRKLFLAGTLYSVCQEWLYKKVRLGYGLVLATSTISGIIQQAEKAFVVLDSLPHPPRGQIFYKEQAGYLYDGSWKLLVTDIKDKPYLLYIDLMEAFNGKKDLSIKEWEKKVRLTVEAIGQDKPFKQEKSWYKNIQGIILRCDRQRDIGKTLLSQDLQQVCPNLQFVAYWPSDYKGYIPIGQRIQFRAVSNTLLWEALG